MHLIKGMCFWELAPSNMVHTLGRLLALLDLFFNCNPISYGLGVEREPFGGLVLLFSLLKRNTSSLYSLVI